MRGLKKEGIKYYADFGKFDSDSSISTFKSIPSDDVVLSGLSQILIKRVCDFVQYMNVAGHNLKKELLTIAALENHDQVYD